MPQFVSPKVLFPATVLLIASSVGARADLKWTETVSIGNKKDVPTSSTTKWMNKNAQRTVTNMAMGPFKMVTNELALCETNQQYTIEDELKIYAETTFSPTAIGVPALPLMNIMGGGLMQPKAPTGPKKTGTQEISYSITEVGTEKIAGIDNKHYVMESTIVSTGCAGNGTQKTKMELWQASIELPAPCFKTNVESAAKATSKAPVQDNCEIKTTIKSSPDTLNNIFNGLTMRMKFGEGESQMVKEVTMVSQAAIPDSEFALPTDYKKVTEAELNKARSAAMMKNIMGGTSGFPGGIPNMGF